MLFICYAITSKLSKKRQRNYKQWSIACGMNYNARRCLPHKLRPLPPDCTTHTHTHTHTHTIVQVCLRCDVTVCLRCENQCTRSLIEITRNAVSDPQNICELRPHFDSQSTSGCLCVLCVCSYPVKNGPIFSSILDLFFTG